MKIVPYKDSRQPIPLRDAFGQLMSEAFWEPFGTLDVLHSNLSGFSMPRMDVSETDKEITVELDAPGFEADDITVDYNDGLLTISGKSFESKEEKTKDKEDRRYHLQERNYEKFMRQVNLPSDRVDEEKIECSMKKSTLKITIPKKDRLKKEKKFSIKVQE